MIFGFFIVHFVNPIIKQALEYFGDFSQVLFLHTFTDSIANATKIFIIQELGQTSVDVVFKKFGFLNICFSKIKIINEPG